MRRRSVRTIAGHLAGALLIAALGGPSRAADEDPVRTEAFRIHHRSVAEAAELVGAVLSEDGSVTLKPGLGVLVVQDRQSVLDQIPGLLASFDVPPRNVEVVVSLSMGTEKPPSPRQAGRHIPRGDGTQGELRGVVESLGDATRWTNYELLGSRSLVSTEGARVVADLSETYRVEFTVGPVTDREVTLEPFRIQKIERGQNGTTAYRTLLTTSVVLRSRGTLMLGAARDPHSDKALFVILRARPR